MLRGKLAEKRQPTQNKDAEKVKLTVYSESGCPNCQSLVAGDLNKTLTADGVVDVLDFDFISFGNAYYLQEECPGYPDYDRTDGVACYQKKCSIDSPPEGCFEGTIACQHGDAECAGNIVQNCVKSLYPDVLTYMSFNYCFEASFDSPHAGEECASEFDALSWEDITACTSDADKVNTLMVAAAQDTVKQLIPGTPTILLNGEAMGSTRTMLKQVCKAYKGTQPKGCQ